MVSGARDGRTDWGRRWSVGWAGREKRLRHRRKTARKLDLTEKVVTGGHVPRSQAALTSRVPLGVAP